VPGAPTRKADKSSRPALLLGAAVLGLFVVPLFLRLFVVEAFKIPAGSMLPTLEIGDHVFVTKSTYGVFSASAPQRGEVVVFTYPDPNPNNAPVDFIKRVIGLPGDILEVEAGAPSINGWKVPRCELALNIETTAEGTVKEVDVFVEFLQGHAYLILLERHEGDDASRRQGPYEVRPGEFWVMGDNRNNSADSRSWRAGQGAGVPFENLRGRAWYVWFPLERMGIQLHEPPVLPKSLKKLQPQLDSCLAKAPSVADSTPPPPR
jgi:signal peptidase I